MGNEVVEAGELTHFASAGKRLLCNLGKDTQSAIDLELAEQLAQVSFSTFIAILKGKTHSRDSEERPHTCRSVLDTTD